MNPNRVDFIVDVLYGLMIFFAIALIFITNIQTGIAFGLGVLVSYVLHVGWKMARFDPEWMTSAVVEQVEEKVTKEMEKTVEATITEEVDEAAEKVGEAVKEEVAETVEKTVSKEVEKTVGTDQSKQ